MIKNDILIAESSWDVESFKYFFSSSVEAYIHNDYFTESNKKNVLIFSRAMKMLKILYKCFIGNKNKIYFSSLNFEAYVPALLVSYFKKNVYFFVPNYFNFRDSRSILIKLFFKLFRGKFYFSDNLSYELAKKGELLKNYYSFNIPVKNFNELIFIVAMPAAYSHNSLVGEAKEQYKEHSKIFEYLNKKRLRVHLLLHPRDREYAPKLTNAITHEEIQNLNHDQVCYVSLMSSLCLNRRYGGKYGFWCRVDKNYCLPENIKNIAHHIQLLNNIIP